MLGKVEVKVKAQEMVEDVTSDSPYGFLGDRGEDGIAKLLEDGGADAGCAIGHNYAATYDDGSSTGCANVDIHSINDALEVERHLNIQDLSADKEGDGDGHADLRIEAMLGP